MEIPIPAEMYFTFWALIGLSFLFHGFHTSNKSGLSDSVSPVVLSLFGHSLSISIFHSSHYALLSRHLPKLPNLRKFFSRFLFWHMILFTCTLFNISFRFNHSNYNIPYILSFLCILELQRFFHVDDIVRRQLAVIKIDHIINPILLNNIHNMTSPIIFLVASFDGYVMLEPQNSLVYGKTKLFPFLIILISQLTSLLWAQVYCAESENQNPNWWTMNYTNIKVKNFIRFAIIHVQNQNPWWTMNNNIKMKKFIQFAVGAAGTILFQYSFKLTSLAHVKVFFCYTIVWLANLALLRPPCGDFGIFTFLLGNVIVGGTVNLFSLGGTTWFIYGACVFLYGLRLTLESLPLVNIQEREVIVLFEKKNLTLTQSQPENLTLTYSQPDRALVLV